MLKRRTAGTHLISAQRAGRSADKLAAPSVPILERLLYCRLHGIDRDSTRLLLCQGANRSCGRHFVNGRQNGGSAMHSSKKSVAKRVGYLRCRCVARFYSRCPTNYLGRTQGSCQSPAFPVERLYAGEPYLSLKPAEVASWLEHFQRERLLSRLVLPVAGHKLLRNAAECSLVRQGGSA